MPPRPGTYVTLTDAGGCFCSPSPLSDVSGSAIRHIEGKSIHSNFLRANPKPAPGEFYLLEQRGSLTLAKVVWSVDT